jgi:ketosteroid isomerase-like protein
MKTSLLVSLVIAGLASVAIAASDEAEIRKLEDQWLDAYVKGDTGVLKTVEADDWAMIDQDGNTTTKAQDIKELGDKTFVCKSAGMTNVKVVMLGENAAYVTATVRLEGTYKGKDISGEYRSVDILEKKDNKWQARYSQLTNAKKEKE